METDQQPRITFHPGWSIFGEWLLDAYWRTLSLALGPGRGLQLPLAHEVERNEFRFPRTM